jgi:hypothetical protein
VPLAQEAASARELWQLRDQVAGERRTNDVLRKELKDAQDNAQRVRRARSAESVSDRGCRAGCAQARDMLDQTVAEVATMQEQVHRAAETYGPLQALVTQLNADLQSEKHAR